jgi:hypothetical protein
MEIEVWSVGKTQFTADPEYQDPMIREVIDQRGDVADVIIDYTDTERSNISHDEYARVTGDVPGLVLFEGWLTGTTDALAQIIAALAAGVQSEPKSVTATETALRLAIAFIEQVRDGCYGDMAAVDAEQALHEIGMP